MKKMFVAVIIAVMLAFVGCNGQTTDNAGKKEDKGDYNGFKVASLKGPTSMGAIKLMSDGKNQFTVAGTADEIVGPLNKGEIDVALIPANLASVLYNKTGGKIQVAGINTLGVLYVVERGNTVNSVGDLKGKRLLSTGKGTTPEYALNYVLSKNNIDAQKDITVDYKAEATQVAGELLAGRGDLALLPQPYVTTVMAKDSSLRIAVSLTDEWNKVSSDSTLVTGVVVVRKEVAENRKKDLDGFLADYKQSVDFVNNNTDEAGELIGAKDIAPAAVAKKAIPFCNIVLIEGDEMKTKLNGYLKALYEQNPGSVGGKLPDEAFYYTK